MDEDEAPIAWRRRVISYAQLLLHVGLPIAGALYLAFGPGPVDFEAFPDWLVDWSPVLFGLIIVGVLLAKPIERLPWYGVLPVPVAEGYAWRRSIRSRLVILAISLVGGWFAIGIFDATFQAYQLAHWPKAVVGSLVSAFCAWRMGRAVFTWRPALTLNSEGLRQGEYGELLPWSRIERISVGHRWGRRVTLMTLKPDGAPGPARTLELGDVGISAHEFQARVEGLAPELEVLWPAEPRSVFAR